MRCWQHNAYYDLESGCSEICLSRILGTPYKVKDMQIGKVTIAGESRANIISVQVSVACQGDSETRTGEIILDTVSVHVPWRHWKIIHSSFGGPLAEPWCQESW